MVLKFKYFFDAQHGIPGEENINKFLAENNIDKIEHAILHNGCLGIFYKENLNSDYLNEVGKRYTDK